MTEESGPLKFDITFEEDVIATCLHDSEYLKSCVRMLDGHAFSTKHHAWVWNSLKETWLKFADLFSPKLALVCARKDFPKDEERKLYIELFLRLFKRTVTTPRASLAQLSDFISFVELQKAMEESAKALSRYDIKKARDLIRRATFRDAGPKVFDEVKWIEDFHERQLERKHRREHPEEYVSVPTGIKGLDRIIGGAQEGEVGLVMGTTGKGKSICLANFAYHAVTHSVETAIFSFEMPARQYAMRLDARWSGLKYKKFKEYDFTALELRELEARHAKMLDHLKGKLRIFGIPIRRGDINLVRNILDGLKGEFNPKLIIFDSADHLNPLAKYNDVRLEQASVYWDLKTFAEEEKKAVWSSTHAGREWADKTATAEAASESYDKSRIADIVVSLNQPKKRGRRTVVLTDDGEADGVAEVPAAPEVSSLPSLVAIEMYLAKYRDGESRIHIPIESDFATMLMREAKEDPAGADPDAT